MFNFNSLVTSVICFLLALGRPLSASAEAPSKRVFLTGKGIATRLHEPVLRQISDATSIFMTIPDNDYSGTNVNITKNDWVFLGTPVYKQFEHLAYLAKHCKNILCEKPVCLSLSEINQLKNLIADNHVLFRVNYALRFLPMIDEIKEFTRNNDVKSVKLVCNAGFNKNLPNKEWKSDVNLGGGILYSIFPHLVDLSIFLFGENDLDKVSFKSSSKIPMDDIKMFSKTIGGIETTIDINLKENFDEFKLEIETVDEKVKTFDLINSSTNKISDTKYLNGSLSATSEISPWRISFIYLLEKLFTAPSDVRFARIEDAEAVHKVLRVILTNV